MYPRIVISIVVPVRDEERSIEPLYHELCGVLDQQRDEWEAVYVDDGSTDGTFAELVRLHDAHDNVRVVRLRKQLGKAAALDAGFAEASGDTIVTIDGDLQDDPAEIPRLLAKLDEGFDLVSGWKTDRRDPSEPTGAVSDLQPRCRLGLGNEASRPELRSQGLSRRGREGAVVVRRAPSVHPAARNRPGVPRGGGAGQPPPPSSTAVVATGWSATSAASSICSPWRSSAGIATARCTSSVLWPRSAFDHRSGDAAARV